MADPVDPQAEAEEHRLVTLAVGGDQDALGQLLVQYHDTLEAYIARKATAKVQATFSVEDVLQQTYLSAFQGVERFQWQGPGSFLAWLRVIAKRKLTDAARKKQKERLSDKRAHSPAGGGGESSMRGLLSVLADDDPGPGDAAMADELQGAFQVALAEMPDNYREVVELRYLQSLSNEAVAERMGVSVGVVRGLCHRARGELRESLMRLSRYVDLR